MDNVTSEKVKLYRMLLLYDHITNTFLNLLFHTFKLMFKKHAMVREHGVPNTYYYLTDDALNRLDSFKTHFYAIDSETCCFEIEVDSVVLKNKLLTLSFYNSTSDTVVEFINAATKITLDVYIQMSNGANVNDCKPEPNIEQMSNVGFIKRIKRIEEGGQMFKYVISFDDDTYHNVITPNALLPQIQVGDFAHLDESNNFNFISKNSIH